MIHTHELNKGLSRFRMFSSTNRRHTPSRSFDGNLMNGLPKMLYSLLFSCINIEAEWKAISASTLARMDTSKVIFALALIEKESTIHEGIALLKEEIHHPFVHYYLPRFYLRDQKHHYSSNVLKAVNKLLNDILEMESLNAVTRSDNFIFAASLYRERVMSWFPTFKVIVPNCPQESENLMRKALELSGKQTWIDSKGIFLSSMPGAGTEAILTNLNCTDIQLLTNNCLINLSRLQNAAELVTKFKELYGANWSQELNSLHATTLIALAYFAYIDENFVFNRENIKVIHACNDTASAFKLAPISTLIGKLGLLHDLGPRFSDISEGLCLSWQYVTGRRLPNPEDVKLKYNSARSERYKDAAQFIPNNDVTHFMI